MTLELKDATCTLLRFFPQQYQRLVGPVKGGFQTFFHKECKAVR